MKPVRWRQQRAAHRARKALGRKQHKREAAKYCLQYSKPWPALTRPAEPRLGFIVGGTGYRSGKFAAVMAALAAGGLAVMAGGRILDPRDVYREDLYSPIDKP